ncbi:hypothetical protein SLITO_v1c08570 [Spiroplasma litorale]|uniref:Thiamine transporter n=1 Tax=Spiroplasma litorale TaxID=216942 RepID=A0A0K1W304_9MOLU|nr:energy-coupled thiamine transporter ThiT [Spiroplasma litorale]AKX34472.1 hypothetical protein SLITO_v1c08570 [Spiroplasma litorale]
MEENVKLKKNYLLISTYILSFVRFFLFTFLLILLSITVINKKTQVYADDGTASLEEMSTLKKSIVVFIFAVIIISYAIISINSVLNFIYNKNDTKTNLVASLIALNIELIIYYLRFLRFNKYEFKKPNITIMDMLSMSILLALFFIVDFLTTGLIPPFPFFITISVKYIVLFFGCYIFNFTKSFILCILCSFVTLLNPGTYVLSFVQFLFDYWLPTTLISLACFFKPSDKIENKFTRSLSWFNFVTVPMIIFYFCRSISGILFWLNPNALSADEISYEFEFNNAVAYSFIYNSFSTVFDFVTLIILVPTICTSLDFIKKRYFYK